MGQPRIAVAGSCVSRDVLSRRFTPDYKERASVIHTTYQSALPSLVREQDIRRIPPETIRPAFKEVIRKEFLGSKLAKIAASQPDVLLVDLFADVHFGVTTVDSLHMTRNHMAFQRPADADAYFQDSSYQSPDRMRYEISKNNTYEVVALSAIRTFRNFWRHVSPETLIILNSARFSTDYINEVNECSGFKNAKRLEEKNKKWAEIDKIFLETTGCEHIIHDPSLFIASNEHPWGLHPVHYTQSYYANLWQSLLATMSHKRLL